MKNILKYSALCALLLTVFTSCDLSLQKDYKYEGSVLDPHINMTAWEYLGSHPGRIFTTYMAAVEHAGMKEYFTQTGTKYTFLALTNDAMKIFMGNNQPDSNLIEDYDVDLVKEMLQYHILEGEYSSYGQLEVEPTFVITELRGEKGLMTMLVRKNPWQADAGKIVVNDTGSNGNSPMRLATSSNIMPVNGVIHVFDNYCYYQN